MRVNGTLRVPGDKSISHRAIMLAALARGRSRITGILQSADVESTAAVLRSLGVNIPVLSSDMVVHGVGRHGLRQPTASLDCGNSGTTTRLMAGVVAGCPMTTTFVGDASLSRRPMRRIARPLEAMGAGVDLPPHGGLPMTIRGGDLHSVVWNTEVASAQIKSAILLAGLVAGVPVTVEEPSRSRDHTERMLMARGVGMQILDERIELLTGFEVGTLDTDVPGDPSSAAFFAALGVLASTGELVISDVCVNETRTGFLDVLRAMGGDVSYDRQTEIGGEWISPIIVRPGALHGIVVTERNIPAMIDELPLLACVATRVVGETVITGASELRVKESDRIAAVVANLRAIGAEATELPDGMRIMGSERPLRGPIETHGDHRLAMAFGILAALPGNEITVDNPDCVAVSYPEFWVDLRRITGGA